MWSRPGAAKDPSVPRGRALVPDRPSAVPGRTATERRSRRQRSSCIAGGDAEHHPQQGADDQVRVGPALVGQDRDRDPLLREPADRRREPSRRPEWPRVGRPSTVAAWTPRPYGIDGLKGAVTWTSATIAATAPGRSTSPPYSARAQVTRSLGRRGEGAGAPGGGHDRRERHDVRAIAQRDRRSASRRVALNR